MTKAEKIAELEAVSAAQDLEIEAISVEQAAVQEQITALQIDYGLSSGPASVRASRKRA